MRNKDFIPYNQWLHQHDETIKAEYADRPTADMAEEQGVNYYTVSRRATRLGVTKSDEFMHTSWKKGSAVKWQKKGEKAKRYTDSGDKYMRAHFADTSNAELAAMFGVDVKTIRRWARRLGLQKSEAFMFETRGRGNRWCYYSDEQKAWRNRRIAEVYPNGTEEDLRQLAEELRLKCCTITNIAHGLGVKRSQEKRSEACRRGHDKTRVFTPELLAAIAEYYPTHSTEECAERFGVNLGSLKARASELGWKKTKEYKHRLYSDLTRRRYEEQRKATAPLP